MIVVRLRCLFLLVPCRPRAAANNADLTVIPPIPGAAHLARGCEAKDLWQLGSTASGTRDQSVWTFIDTGHLVASSE